LLTLLSPEPALVIRAQRQAQTATFRIHHLSALRMKHPPGLALVLLAPTKGLGCARLLQTAPLRTQQGQALVVAAQLPVAAGLEQLLFLAVGEPLDVLFVGRPATPRFWVSQGQTWLQGSDREGRTGHPLSLLPTRRESHGIHPKEHPLMLRRSAGQDLTGTAANDD
jgi:hypothetical protein